jgi:hypothetical protein
MAPPTKMRGGRHESGTAESASGARPSGRFSRQIGAGKTNGLWTSER